MASIGRVVVTGGTGFIGGALLPALVAAGYEVHALTRQVTSRPTPGVTWHRLDLLSPEAEVREALGRIGESTLIHLAWSVPTGRWDASLDNVQCLEASLRLIRAFQGSGGHRVLVTGSCAEYDVRYGFCSEDLTPVRPNTLYGRCKNALHDILVGLAQSGDLSVAWARIFFLYGPGESPNRLVPSVIRALAAGEQPGCTHGLQVRDFLHVHDVADALLSIAGSSVDGAVNVASGQPLSVREMVSAIEAEMSSIGRTRFGAIAMGPLDAPFIVADVRRLREEIGWQPSIPLAMGLASTVAWWRPRSSA